MTMRLYFVLWVLVLIALKLSAISSEESLDCNVVSLRYLNAIIHWSKKTATKLRDRFSGCRVKNRKVIAYLRNVTIFDVPTTDCNATTEEMPQIFLTAYNTVSLLIPYWDLMLEDAKRENGKWKKQLNRNRYRFKGLQASLCLAVKITSRRSKCPNNKMTNESEQHMYATRHNTEPVQRGYVIARDTAKLLSSLSCKFKSMMKSTKSAAPFKLTKYTT